MPTSTPYLRPVATTDDGTRPGAVFVIGGAEDKSGRRELLQRFVREAAAATRRKPTIAVVPTASTLGPEVVQLYDALFRKLGAGSVVALRPETRAEAQNPAIAEPLADVDAVFMTGGNQLKLAGVCVGTRFGRAIVDVHARGGVVGGTSAGASIVSEHMVAFGPGGMTPRHRMSQLARGLGLLPDVVVDQHFRERDRLGRLLSLIAESPSLLGIGIDEDTAAVVRGRTLEVAGRGAVTIVDAEDAVTSAPTAKASRPILVAGAVVHTLPAGATFDLEGRTLQAYAEPLPPTELAEIAATEKDMRKLAKRIAREDAAPPRRRTAHRGDDGANPDDTP